MSRINLEVAVHKLNVREGIKLVKLKRRVISYDRQKIIDEEVAKLLGVEFIFEIGYPEWLADIVLVKKYNGRWRMCVAYIDLNKLALRIVNLS